MIRTRGIGVIKFQGPVPPRGEKSFRFIRFVDFNGVDW